MQNPETYKVVDEHWLFLPLAEDTPDRLQLLLGVVVLAGGEERREEDDVVRVEEVRPCGVLLGDLEDQDLHLGGAGGLERLDRRGLGVGRDDGVGNALRAERGLDALELRGVLDEHDRLVAGVLQQQACHHLELLRVRLDGDAGDRRLRGRGVGGGVEHPEDLLVGLCDPRLAALLRAGASAGLLEARRAGDVAADGDQDTGVPCQLGAALAAALGGHLKQQLAYGSLLVSRERLEAS